MAINNTLHAVVTGNGSGADSKVVIYTIASVIPTVIPSPTVIAHTVLPNTPFNASGGTNSGNAQAVVVNGAGHIFVGNAGSGAPVPSIVELNPGGSVANTFTLPSGCVDTGGQLASIDLSADGSSVYLTSKGGTIQKFTFASPSSCTPFANLGPGVNFYGVQDIPPGALAAVSPDCNGTGCPSNETVLVVAKGFFDSDGDPGIEPGGIPDQGDDVNICTNLLNSPLVSCALLLDRGGPGLTASPWVGSNQYLSTGVRVLDANLHVQQVATPGTSGLYGATPFHPVWNEGGMTVDNAVTWVDIGVCDLDTCPSAWTANTTYAVNDEITNSNNRIQEVTVAGTSGPTEPSWANTDNATIMDGLTWTDQGTSLVARYPVTGTSTLQALTLDPLVVDCTGTRCAAWQATHAYVLNTTILDPAGHVQKVTTAGTSGGTQPTFNDSGGTTPSDGSVTWTDQGRTSVSNFWLGDSANPNFYEVSFGNGSVTRFDTSGNNANADCSSHAGCTTFSSVQGLRIYGAEGANQADLTKLFTGPLNSGNHFTASVQFPPLVSPFTNNDVNTWTVTQYQSNTSTPVTLYASLIAQASAPANGNNSGATDVNAVTHNPPVPCQPTTTDPSKCIMWKADLLLLPPAYLAENLTSPTGIDNGTNVFVDLHYNVTTAVGNFDPPGRSSGSVHSLHEITTTIPPSGAGSSGCFYLTPAPDGACFKNNRTTLPFVFQCTGLTPSQMASLKNSPGPPMLSMVRSSTLTNPKPAPETINLTTTNTKAPYRYDATANDYVFNWSPQGITGTFRACTFDFTNTVQTFCVNFTMKTKCP